MGSRRTDGQTRGLIIHDPKITIDAVNDAESSYSQAGAYYLPPTPSNSNLGNAELRVSGSIPSYEAPTEYELLFTRGGTAGSAGYLVREPGETYIGTRPLWQPGALEAIADVIGSPQTYNAWQVSVLTTRAGTTLAAWYNESGFALPQIAIYRRDVFGPTGSWTSQHTLSPNWDYAANRDATTVVTAMPILMEPQAGVVHCYYWRPVLAGGDITLYLDCAISTDNFDTDVRTISGLFRETIDTSDFNQIIGYAGACTENGMLLALYLQLDPTSVTNEVRVYASSDGGNTWQLSETLYAGSSALTSDGAPYLAMWADKDGKITIAYTWDGASTVRVLEKTAIFEPFQRVYSGSTAAINMNPLAGCALNDGRNMAVCGNFFYPYAYRGQFNGDGLFEGTGLITPNANDAELNATNNGKIIRYGLSAYRNGAILAGIYSYGSAISPTEKLFAMAIGQNEAYAAPYEPPDNLTANVYRGFTAPDYTQTGVFGPNHGNLVNTNGYTIDIDGTASYYRKNNGVDIDKGIVVEFGIQYVSGTGNPVAVVVTSSGVQVNVRFTSLTATGVTITGTATSTAFTATMTNSGVSLNCFRVVVPAIRNGAGDAKAYVFHKRLRDTEWTLIHEETQTTGSGSLQNDIYIGSTTAQTAEFVLYQLDYWQCNALQDEGGDEIAYAPETSQNPITLASASGFNYLDTNGSGDITLTGVGGLAAQNDTFTLFGDYRYPLRNIFPSSEPSPSRTWRSNSDSDAETITIDLGYDGLYPLTGTFGFYLRSNLKNIKLALSATPADTSGSLYDSSASGRIGPRLYTNTQGIVKRGGLYPSDTASQYSHFLRANELQDGWVDLSGGVQRLIRSNTSGYWMGDGTKQQKSVIALQDVDLTEPATAGAVTIVTGSVLVLLPGFVPNDTARYLTIYIPSQQTPQNYYEINQFVAGWFHAFGWAHDESSVRETAYNRATYADAYGRRRYRQLGPKRRAFEVSWGNGFPQNSLYSGSSVSSDGSPWRGAALEDQAADFWRLDPSASVDSLPEGSFSDVYGAVEEAMGAQSPAVLVLDVPNAATASVIECNLPSRFCYGRVVSDSLREERFAGREDWQDDAVRIATLRFEEDV